MKNQLLATTALVAVGVLGATELANAQTVKLGVGGYMRQEFGVVFDRDTANTNGRPDVTATGNDTGNSFDTQSDVEVYFLGSGKLDNGIEVGVRVELEVAGSPGNQIDEQYLFLRGAFGQFEIGSTDSAAIKTTIGYMGSWATQVGDNSAFGPGDWINGACAGSAVANACAGNYGGQDGTLRNMQLRMFDDDGNKISYYTPRFEGFQIGVSYTPNTEQNNFAGTGGSPPTPTGTELTTTTKGLYHDYWSVGANFDRKFDELAVGVSAGFVTAKSPGRTNTATVNNTDDPMTYGFGVALEWGPFKISGAYRENKDVFDGGGTRGGQAGQTTAANTTSLDGSLFDVGGRYTFGPNAVSVTYRSGSVDGIIADPAEASEEAFMVSFRRTLGPGVNWDANVFWLKTETEPTVVAGSINPQKVDGWAFTTAIQLAF